MHSNCTAQEDALASAILEVARAGFPVKARQLRVWAHEYAKDHGIKGFSKDGKMAGRKWLKGFLNRYPNIKLKQANNLSIHRAMGANKAVVDKFFAQYINLKEHLGIKSGEQIWNTDESGVQDIPQSEKVLGEKGRKAFRTVSKEQGETTTVVSIINAAGLACPPLVIFKGTRFHESYARDAMPGTLVKMSKKGYVNKEIFLEYMTRWLRYVRSHKLLDRPHILLLDSHGSHVYNVPFLELMKAHDIHVLAIPAHCTHVLQPLDGPCFSILKREWQARMSEYTATHHGLAMPKEHFWIPFIPSWRRGMSVGAIQASFRKSGIYPVDRSRIKDADLGPSRPTDNIRILEERSKMSFRSLFGL